MTKTIMVETSARHVHITKEALATLFGAEYQLTRKKDLSQPGQFACEERVSIIGPKGEMKNIIVLGPTRNSVQVELSLSDARKIGIIAPIRESGDLAGTPGCTIVGPKGSIELSEGVIAAKRHIHLSPEDAKEFGVTDKQVVQVEVSTEQRSLVFGDVVCRVSPNFKTAMHIDTDESNAAGCGRDVQGIIIK